MKKINKAFAGIVAACALVVGLSLFTPGPSASAAPFGPISNQIIASFTSTQGASAFTLVSSNFQFYGGYGGLAIFTDLNTVGNTNSITNSTIMKLAVSKDNVAYSQNGIVTNTVTITNTATNQFHHYFLIPKTLVDGAAWGQFSVTMVTDGTNSVVVNVYATQFP